MGYKYASILNDVLGPVMRGPSSSHCAAALRIGNIARELVDGELDEVIIEFDSKGSLASTHESQGSDMGLFAGLMGWSPDEERLRDSAQLIREAGIRVSIKIEDFDDPHPNTYRLTLKNRKEVHRMVALSTGGGMVRVVSIDEIPVSIDGDFYETLLFIDGAAEALASQITEAQFADRVAVRTTGTGRLVQVSGQEFVDSGFLSRLKQRFEIGCVKFLSPVLPVLSRENVSVPFLNCAQLLEFNQDKKLPLWELAAIYESARGGISRQEIFDRTRSVVQVMRNAIDQGVQGTHYSDRILGHQSKDYLKTRNEKLLFDTGILDRVIPYVTATMEVKSALGVIVAAPTAGACGLLPGTCLGAADVLGLSETQQIQGVLAAGLIGVFILSTSTFAAEVGGCQAECGAASGMAAAALVSLAGGSAEAATGAASMALQNIMGSICDPVANRVEVPCLGRNVMGAANAVACSNMILAGYDPVIPLDEVITAMDKVGRSIPSELRCTAKGGLSATPTARRIELSLNRQVRPG